MAVFIKRSIELDLTCFDDLMLVLSDEISSPDLKGKGAIVTGGGSGICLAFTNSCMKPAAMFSSAT